MTAKRFSYEYFEVYDKGFFLDNGKRMLKDDVLNTLNVLHEENEQLKIRFNEERERALKFGRNIDTLTVQNEQLQARNDRQAKQLDRLYQLISQKDWRTLTDIMDDFKRCEEQLQREWGTYGDVE